ncbi:MAG: hypothetical protein D6750_06660, partial [Bacteroidetes bacterium]
MGKAGRIARVCLRLVLWGAITWIAFLLAIQGVLATESGQHWARKQVVAFLSEALDTEVTLERLRLSGLAHLALEGLVVYDKAGQPFLQTQTLEVHWNPFFFWRGIWRGRLHLPVSSLRLVRPQVYLYTECATGLTNIDRLFPPDTTEPSPQPLRISLGSLQLVAGRLRWVDSTQGPSLPRPPFLAYDNLDLDSLDLEGAVEWLGNGRLFLHLRHLSARERHTGFTLQRLSGLIQAYPDSTVIPHLEIQLAGSWLRLSGRFTREGLDKLFSDTKTKFFTTLIEGEIDWADISALAGDSLPIRGRWKLTGSLQGDEYHLTAQHLRVGLTPTEFLNLRSGTIWHYARPALLHWRAEIAEAALSAGTLTYTVPDVGELEFLNTAYVWHLRGLHTGRLHTYTAELEGEGLALKGTLSRDSVWRYRAELRLHNWPAQTIFPLSPVDSLTGEVDLEGASFDLATLTGALRAELAGLYPRYGPFRAETHIQLASQQATGHLHWQGGFGEVMFRGTLPLGPGGAFAGEGTFSDLQGSLWGASGRLSGAFSLAGNGYPWAEGQGRLHLSTLLWQRADTVIRLPDLHAEAEQGTFYRLEGAGVSVSIRASPGWVEGISPWLNSWKSWISTGTWPGDTLEQPWHLQVQVYLALPVWEELVGLANLPESYGLTLHVEAQMAPPTPTVQVRLTWDSLQQKALHIGPTSLAITLKGTGLPTLDLTGTSQGGQYYLLYENLRLTAAGPLSGGRIALHTQLGSQHDTLYLALQWAWPGGQSPFRLMLEPSSFFSLGGQPWHFAQVGRFTLSAEGQWSLSEIIAQAPDGHVHFSRDSAALLIQADSLSLSALLGVLGYTLPVEGLLSAQWFQAYEAPTFQITLKNLAYQGQRYPDLWAEGTTQGDSVSFSLGLGERHQPLFGARGWYNLADSLSPLQIETGPFALPVAWAQPFLGQYLEQVRGTLRSSRLVVRGPLAAPQAYGELFCDGVSFYMPLTRTSYRLEGVMRLRHDTLFLPSVELQDARQKRAYLLGYIAFPHWSDAYLQVKARLKDRAFLLSAIPPTTDAYLYGRAELEEGELTLEGPWRSPFLRGTIRFAESTELTLPLQTYERSEGLSYVEFVGSQKDTLRDTTLQAPTGVNMRITLLTVPQARFRLLFDERTGDEVIAQGTSSLVLSISREGEVALSGSYEVQGGEYRVSLQGLAAKRLFLEAGSFITWDGDLYEGRLNLSAVYRTFSSLRMIDTAYTNTLPVEVRVFLEGTLLSPKLRFQVDVPSVSGSATPLVNLFLQRLASDEAERNRQVFALLVLGSFVPPEQAISSQEVSSGVSATLAEFLSAQLASWLGQSLSNQVGVAFTMGQWNELSAQLRLSLGSRLTVERDGILVSPGQNAASLGNLSARYRILPKRLTRPT